jgi:hypothetical protein
MQLTLAMMIATMTAYWPNTGLPLTMSKAH